MKACTALPLVWRVFPHPLPSWVSFPAKGFLVCEGRAADAASDDHPVAIPWRRGPREHREQRRRFLACDGPLDYQLCAARGEGEQSNESARMMPGATEPSAMTLAREVGLAFGQRSSCGISYRGAALTPNVSRVIDGECLTSSRILT